MLDQPFYGQLPPFIPVFQIFVPPLTPEYPVACVIGLSTRQKIFPQIHNRSFQQPFPVFLPLVPTSHTTLRCSPTRLSIHFCPAPFCENALFPFHLNFRPFRRFLFFPAPHRTDVAFADRLSLDFSFRFGSGRGHRWFFSLFSLIGYRVSL